MLPLNVYEVNAAFQRKITAGAKVRMPIFDMFWGDRYGKVMDPFWNALGFGDP